MILDDRIKNNIYNFFKFNKNTILSTNEIELIKELVGYTDTVEKPFKFTDTIYYFTSEVQLISMFLVAAQVIIYPWRA